MTKSSAALTELVFSGVRFPGFRFAPLRAILLSPLPGLRAGSESVPHNSPGLCVSLIDFIVKYHISCHFGGKVPDLPNGDPPHRRALKGRRIRVSSFALSGQKTWVSRFLGPSPPG